MYNLVPCVTHLTHLTSFFHVRVANSRENKLTNKFTDVFRCFSKRSRI